MLVIILLLLKTLFFNAEGRRKMMPFHIPGDQLQTYDIDKNGIKISRPADLPELKMMPEFTFRII